MEMKYRADQFGRLEFIKMAGASLAGLSLFRSFPAGAAASNDLLVVIFLHGGCDGLNFVTPLKGPDRKIYEDERPNLQMPLTGPAALLPLNTDFGIHPSAKGLHQFFTEKRLAVVHAAGINANTRSHFDAQNIIELGSDRVLDSGWLARTLLLAGGKSGLNSMTVGPLVPTSLASNKGSFSLTDINRLNLGGQGNLQDEQFDIVKSMYDQGNTWIHQAGNATLESLKYLRDFKNRVATNPSRNDYPKTDLGGRMRTLAQLLRLGLDVPVATLDMGGWDTHKYQGSGLDGVFAKQVEQLSQAVTAFTSDLETAPKVEKKVTVLIMSEFGRRLRENANRGTDHGHGGVFFVLGPNVQGGKMHGKWPGLQTEKLYERADLAVTTDYRTVLTETAQGHFNLAKIDTLFPGYKAKETLGLFSKKVV